MARYVATGLASLIAVAIVASGNRLWALSDAGIAREARLVNAEREISELHGYIDQINRRWDAFPSAADLTRCSQRLEVLEQQNALTTHRLKRIEDGRP